MLPSERNELLVRRVGLLLIALMVLFIIVWTVRFVSLRAHRLMEQRNVPVEEGRARVMKVG